MLPMFWLNTPQSLTRASSKLMSWPTNKKNTEVTSFGSIENKRAKHVSTFMSYGAFGGGLQNAWAWMQMRATAAL
eukprot:5720025-Amphidinium_carterae.1